ncbi:hypothetical protein SLS62_001176 [Diatrype stigma]|uniref:Uncharacterized protein n=1 Tax=Diatrype stigma TaxID=117547 RepID=A0AAN9UYK9_9PEZI
MEDKAARSVGAVHRPSDSPESSHPPPVVSTAENAAVGSTSTSTNTNTSGGDGGSGGDSGSTNPPKPPPYSGPTANPSPQRQSQRGNGPQYYPGLPVLDYRQYAPPLFELSSDKTTITSKASYLSENAGALAALIRNVARVPPKPYIQVQGSRGGGHNIDFAVKMNLMTLLVPEDAGRRMDYLRCVGQGEVACRGGHQPALQPDLGPDAGLEDWCERFVRDPAPIKTFALERVVANLDVDWIEGQLRSLVAATGYKGVVTVQFPIAHAKVVVQNPDRVNRFFTSVTSLFTGRNKYEVVKAVWPFATSPNNSSSSGGGGGERQCVVQSERTWWAEWKDIIRYAIATKRRGWVTNEDRLEYIMEGLGREVPATDWDVEY